MRCEEQLYNCTALVTCDLMCGRRKILERNMPLWPHCRMTSPREVKLLTCMQQRLRAKGLSQCSPTAPLPSRWPSASHCSS